MLRIARISLSTVLFALSGAGPAYAQDGGGVPQAQASTRTAEHVAVELGGRRARLDCDHALTPAGELSLLGGETAAAVLAGSVDFSPQGTAEAAIELLAANDCEQCTGALALIYQEVDAIAAAVATQQVARVGAYILTGEVAQGYEAPKRADIEATVALRIRLAIASEVARRGGEQHQAILLAALEDASPLVRVAAAFGLSQEAGFPARPLVERLLANSADDQERTHLSQIVNPPL